MNAARESCIRARALLTCVLVLSAFTAQSMQLHAQPAAAARPTEGTVGDMIRAARTSARVARFEDTMPAQYARLVQQLDALQRNSLDTVSIARIGTALMTRREHAPMASVARWKSTDAVAPISPREGLALDTLARIALQFLPELLEVRVSEDSTDALLSPIREFNRARLSESLAQSLEKLRRYERKYGPTSPKLNAAEVVLNYIAQSMPPFRSSADGWPSAYEVVSSYVPSYLTVHDDRLQAWTVLEAGIRKYIFDPAWGAGGWQGVLRPGHVSVGVAVVNERAGALTEPWRGRNRMGGYVAWGSAKIAVVGGDGPRFLITRQVQILPFVF